jgi:hypothetical protein
MKPNLQYKKYQGAKLKKKNKRIRVKIETKIKLDKILRSEIEKIIIK